MNRKEYEEKRQALINEAETFINEGKLEEANKKMEAVTELDKNFEAAAKAEANLRAPELVTGLLLEEETTKTQKICTIPWSIVKRS